MWKAGVGLGWGVARGGGGGGRQRAEESTWSSRGERTDLPTRNGTDVRGMMGFCRKMLAAYVPFPTMALTNMVSDRPSVDLRS